ncbi:MAG: lysozyme, partial [bacterium]
TRLIGGVLALAISLIGAWGGLKLTTYKDVVGAPTVCYGETRGVKMGQKYTKAECDLMFAKALVEFEKNGLRKCVKNPDAIPDKSYVAFLDLSYNIGTGGFCKSTLVKKLNAGDVLGACHELKKFVRGGGRVIKGLQNRRADMLKRCLEGVKAGPPRIDVAVAPPHVPVPRPNPGEHPLIGEPPPPTIAPAPSPRPKSRPLQRKLCPSPGGIGSGVGSDDPPLLLSRHRGRRARSFRFLRVALRQTGRGARPSPLGPRSSRRSTLRKQGQRRC